MLQFWPPLVTCICPTKDRRAFIPSMLQCFANQDWPNKELIVVDDGFDSVEDLCASIPNVRYIRLEDGTTIGAKRNLACELAKGEIIAHFDDDDFYAPGYLTYMVDTIRRYDVAITGLHTAPFVNRTTGQAFVYRNHPTYAIGATLTYLKAHWIGHPFRNVSLGEDNLFQRAVNDRERFFVQDQGFFIATDHGNNTSPRDYDAQKVFDGADLLKIINPAAVAPKPKAKQAKR